MSRSSHLTGCLVAVLFAARAGGPMAQPRESEPVDLPDGPAKAGFDIERFSNAGNGWFETFYVEQTESLRKALDDGRLATGTRMLVMQNDDGYLAFVTDQMAYHHLAQGTSEGKHWLATF